MDGIKTDLFPCNLRTGKKYGRKSGDSEVGERKASFRNVVISVEEIVKSNGTKEFLYTLCYTSSRNHNIYTERQINLTTGINGCAQPYAKLCRFAAVAGAILTADFVGCEYRVLI